MLRSNNAKNKCIRNGNAFIYSFLYINFVIKNRIYTNLKNYKNAKTL